MKERHYIQLGHDGSCEYVTEQRTQKNLSMDLIERIGSKAPIHLPNLFESSGDSAGIIRDNTQMFAYKFMTTLKLNCTFKITGESILRPIFINEDERLKSGDAYPQFVAEWKVPETMRLMFAAKVNPNSHPIWRFMTNYNHGCMLIAWSGKVAYRLPLPNLYDNCDMCTGKFEGIGKTVAGAFQRAVDQMEKSSWNSDLLEEVRQRNADELFQFKPMPDGTMQSIPYVKDWKVLCPTAGNTNIEILGGAL